MVSICFEESIAKFIFCKFGFKSVISNFWIFFYLTTWKKGFTTGEDGPLPPTNLFFMCVGLLPFDDFSDYGDPKLKLYF